MQLIKIFPKLSGGHVKLNKKEFIQYKIRILVVCILWFICAVGIIGFWDDLLIPFRILFIGYCCFIIPGIETFESLFISYEKYCSEGF